MKCKRKSIETILSIVAQNGTNLTYLHVFKKILESGEIYWSSTARRRWFKEQEEEKLKWSDYNLKSSIKKKKKKVWEPTKVKESSNNQINLTRSMQYFNGEKYGHMLVWQRKEKVGRW